MRKSLLILSSVMSIIANAQAADEIPIQVRNTSWPFKTRLECCADYGDTKETMSLILEVTTDSKPVTTTDSGLPKGLIQSIKLDLTHYDETPGSDDAEETLIAQETFTPDAPSLLRVIFTIQEHTITSEAIYD